MKSMSRALTTGALFALAASAQAQVQITEWMYNGAGATGEYIEFTNLGSSAVNFAGWSFDDDSRAAGTVSLSAFGLVNPGQSVILTEATAADFRNVWGLSAAVKVIGSNTTNLGRSDEINLFNAGGQLVDRFAYSDQTFPGTIRAQNISGNPGSLADLAGNTVTTGWVLSSVGDAFGSHASSAGDVGNPGVFTLAVPEPGTYALLLAGLAVVVGVARRRSA